MRFVQIQQAPAGADIIGIEITDPALASRCAVNIDGQHGMAGTPDAWRGRAAIELATEVPIPAADATIAFLRPDLDAVGAAAVLVLRQLGLWDGAGEEARDRVRLVAERDSFRPAAEWAPSPLPTEEQPWPIGAAAVSDTRELAAVASICSPRRGDVERPLAERVLIVAHWLLWGESHAACTSGDPCYDPGGCGHRLDVERTVADALGLSADRAWTPDGCLRDARERVEASRLALVRAVRESGLARHQRSGALELWCAECGDACTEDGWCGTGCAEACRAKPGRRVAVVRVAQAGALAIGYCVAPVVVAVDQATPGKFTVASWTPAHLDHGAFRLATNAAEGRAEIAWLGTLGRDELDAWLGERAASGRRMYADRPELLQEVERDASVARHHPPVDPRAASAIAGLVHRCSPQWGGAAAITGSPQVPGGSRLTERQVLEAAMGSCC